jgi:hypothetical protein
MTKKRTSKSAPTAISVLERAGFFAEDKDIAAKVRDDSIRPAVAAGRRVILDFKDVVGATQSFIHALIAAVIRDSSSEALELLEFKSCNESIKGVISIVVEYCQLDVGDDQAEARDDSGKSTNGRQV